MRLSISNIAWDISEDKEISNILLSNKIDAIDIAPGKYFADPVSTSDVDILKIKQWWSSRGIEITGMQALLFGRPELNIFSPIDIQQVMLDYLTEICRIGAVLGATRLVFGSPKNRNRGNLNNDQALDIAIPFFYHLGEIAKTYGVIICLEPNPKYYGSNFMMTHTETAKVVQSIGHPAIRMQLDTGALAINNENIDEIFTISNQLIGHIHASEPDLLPLGESGVDHNQVYNTLSQYQYKSDNLICIEMVATTNESHMISIERSLSHTIKCYRRDRTA